MASVVQRMLDIFRLERTPPGGTLPESDTPSENNSGVTENYTKLRDFIYELEAKVIESAMESGVSINPQALEARGVAADAHGDDGYEETATMFFEDVLLALEVARVRRFDGLAVQRGELISAATTMAESLKFLRDVFEIGVGKGIGDEDDPLKKFIEAELMLWEKVGGIERKLQLEKKSSKGREPG